MASKYMINLYISKRPHMIHLPKLVFYFPKQVLQTAASDISHDYKDFNQIEIKVTRHFVNFEQISPILLYFQCFLSDTGELLYNREANDLVVLR